MKFLMNFFLYRQRFKSFTGLIGGFA